MNEISKLSIRDGKVKSSQGALKGNELSQVSVLTSQFSRLNIKEGVAKFDLMRFQDQQVGVKAQKFSISADWDKLMGEMRRCVREQFGETADENCIHFCCYIRGGEHRVDFSNVECLQENNVVNSVVLFWIGEPKDKPDSPDKSFKKLREELAQERKERQKELEREREMRQELERKVEREREELEQVNDKLHQQEDTIQRLKLVSTTQAIQEEYNKHVPWKIDEVEHWLKGEVESFDVQPLEKQKLEPPVQNWWSDMLLGRFPSVIDTHSKCELLGKDGTQHKPDFTMVCGPSVLWERLDRVLEVRPSIITVAEKRDVVIQVYTRLIEVLDHQPERVVVYGAALDHANACFVRVERKLSDPNNRTLFVSDCLKLFQVQEDTKSVWSDHGELLLRFLNLSAVDCGYVEVKLPKVLGVEMESVLCRRKNVVLYLADDAVYKVTKEAQKESEFLKRLKSCNPQVCPGLLNSKGDAFSMQKGIDARAVEKLNLAQLTKDLFWAIYQMHDVGVVHCDIKPSNVVLLNNVFCLIDFDAAIHWRDAGAQRRRWTKEFASSGLILEQDTKDYDMVGLFWTVTFFVARKELEEKWRSSNWTKATRLEWGLDMITNENSLLRGLGVVPSNERYPCRLVHPSQVIREFKELRKENDSQESWIQQVRRVEAERGWPSCPLPILEQVWKE